MTSKPKCKYWDACYRTAHAHLAAYAHPPKTSTKKRGTTPADRDSDVPTKKARTDAAPAPKPMLTRDKSRDNDKDKDKDKDKPSLPRGKSKDKVTSDAEDQVDSKATATNSSYSKTHQSSSSTDPSTATSSPTDSLDDLLPVSSVPIPPHPLPRLHRMSHIDSLSSTARQSLWHTELAALYSMSMPHDLIHLWECALRYGMEHGATVPKQADTDTPSEAQQNGEDKDNTDTQAAPTTSNDKSDAQQSADTNTDTKSTESSTTSSTPPFLSPSSTPYISPATPFLELLSHAGLSLCGPYDIMSGQWAHRDASRVNVHLHFRYWYDPPEMMTVLRAVSDDPDNDDVKTAVHYGYWRDDPSNTPTFLVQSSPGDHNNDATRVTDLTRACLTPAGSSIHTCIIHHIKSRIKTTTSNVKKHMQQVLDVIEKDAKQHGYETNKAPNKEKAWTTRQKKLIATTINSIGLIVPVVNEVGYRP